MRVPCTAKRSNQSILKEINPEHSLEGLMLKLNIKKIKIMTSGPITSWQIEEKLEAVTDFLYLGSKITVNGDCSKEIKRRLLLGRKAVTKLDSILKSRDITLLTKVRRKKKQTMGFSQ